MRKSIVKVACASGHCAVDADLLFTPRSTHHYHKKIVVHLEMVAVPQCRGVVEDHAAATIAKAGVSAVLRGG